MSLIEFRPTDNFKLTGVGDGTVWTGPAPIDSTDERGADFRGQTWLLDGKERVVAAVETFLLPKPVRKGDAIGIVFAPDENPA
jgi:hypothetical protein